MNQMPMYRPQNRDAQAPQPGPQPQTQENNGGPKGFGQPAAPNRMSQPPQGRSPQPPQGPPPAQTPGNGQPPNLYPPQMPPNPAYQLWSNRNSLSPDQLITQAFVAYTGQPPTPEQIQMFMQSASNTDDLVQQLINLQHPGQPSMVQQAVNPNPQF